MDSKRNKYKPTTDAKRAVGTALTEDEYDAFVLLCEVEMRSMSSMLRFLVVRELRRATADGN